MPRTLTELNNTFKDSRTDIHNNDLWYSQKELDAIILGFRQEHDIILGEIRKVLKDKMPNIRFRKDVKTYRETHDVIDETFKKTFNRKYKGHKW